MRCVEDMKATSLRLSQRTKKNLIPLFKTLIRLAGKETPSCRHDRLGNNIGLIEQRFNQIKPFSLRHVSKTALMVSLTNLCLTGKFT